MMKIHLEIVDPEVMSELARHAEGAEREGYALAALRLGVLALRQARGEIDGAVIRHESERLIAEMRRVLVEHTTRITGDLAASLKAYLDPGSGSLTLRLERLVRSDGELASILSAHLGPGDSELARTLAAAVGENSPLFRLLSPTQADGLLATMTAMLSTSLEQHRLRIVQEFSLDRQDSALSRLVRSLIDQSGHLREEFRSGVDSVIRQFSLDEPGSALSRLVGEVVRASTAMMDEFSLDQESSVLSRLRRELLSGLGTLTRAQTEFHAKVRATLEAFRARREASRRSTGHGREFEALVCEVLGTEAPRLGDIFEECGASPGLIRNSKVGDAIAELGPDSAAPGARIAIEAKAERNYDTRRALDELQLARQNRAASVGMLVLARRVASAGLEPLSRFGDDILVVWDEDDPATDIYLVAGYSLARALVVSHARRASGISADFEIVDAAILEITRRVQGLEEIMTSAQTVQNSGEKILARARVIRSKS